MAASACTDFSDSGRGASFWTTIAAPASGRIAASRTRVSSTKTLPRSHSAFAALHGSDSRARKIAARVCPASEASTVNELTPRFIHGRSGTVPTKQVKAWKSALWDNRPRFLHGGAVVWEMQSSCCGLRRAQAERRRNPFILSLSKDGDYFLEM